MRLSQVKNWGNFYGKSNDIRNKGWADIYFIKRELVWLFHEKVRTTKFVINIL